MNKRLVRIISGAAAGAAAAYLLSSKNRNGILSGIRDLSESVTGMFGGDAEAMTSATTARTSTNNANTASGRTQARSAGRPKGSGNVTSRRG